MTSRQVATVKTYVKIDVSPDGISLFIEGLDSDLAELLVSAGSFHALPSEYHTFDTSDVTIKTDKVLAFVDPPVVVP